MNLGPFWGTYAPAIDPPMLRKRSVRPSGLHLTFSPRISPERIILKKMVTLEVHAIIITPARLIATIFKNFRSDNSNVTYCHSMKSSILRGAIQR